MITRFANLVIASCFFLLAIGSAIGANWQWAGSPSPPNPASGPLAARGIIMITVCSLWVLGAFMMFFHSRTAWTVSIIGAFQAVVFFLWVLTDMAEELLFRRAQVNDDIAKVGVLPVILSAVTMIGFMAGCFGICATLLISLLKKRAEFRWF
jgi:uncharacterized membrane protein